jgi:Cu(I)/Ag(I) efflux system membrane fusion protein
VKVRQIVIIILVLTVAAPILVPNLRHGLLEFFSLETTELAQGTFFTCPMHPEIRLPQLGECPICGMSLVEKTEVADSERDYVSVTPRQIQLSGIAVQPVERRALYKEIDTYGKIDYDETKLGVVSAWVGGRIDRLYIDFTGVTINKGHPLVDLYSPDLITARREHNLARDNLDRLRGSGFAEAIGNAEELVQSTRQRLLWLGMDVGEINALGREKRLDDHVRINAPHGGTIIRKEVYAGQYVKEGDVLFHIADLARVWLNVDIYEDEISSLFHERAGDYFECTMHPEVTSRTPGTCTKCGMDLVRTNKSVKVEIEIRAFPDETFQGYISFADPFLNPETRTVRVRVNIDNPDLRLKPDMFARVKIRLPVGEPLAVPESAVIHSGTRKIVLVEEEPGRFRPKLVRLGRLWLKDIRLQEAGRESLDFSSGATRYHEVLDGLRAGERLVTSGNFLLGSESQLQGALARMLEDADAVTEPARMLETGDHGHKHNGTEDGLAEEREFDSMLGAYFGITNKLATDTAEGVADLATRIAGQAVNVTLKNAATALAETDRNDIADVRMAYRQLGEAMIAYIRQHRSDIKNVPNLAFCPMAGADGSYWLTSEDQIRNPYFGSSMLRCGRFREWNE